MDRFGYSMILGEGRISDSFDNSELQHTFIRKMHVTVSMSKNSLTLNDLSFFDTEGFL